VGAQIGAHSSVPGLQVSKEKYRCLSHGDCPTGLAFEKRRVSTISILRGGGGGGPRPQDPISGDFDLVVWDRHRLQGGGMKMV